MKKTTISLLLSLLFINAFAQSNDLSPKKTSIYISPFTLLYHQPRINIGIEHEIYKKSSIALSFGYGNAFNNVNSKLENYQYYDIRPEFKYYLDWFIWDAYISSELFASLQQEKLDNDYFESIEGKNVYFETADYKSIKYGLNIVGSLKPYLIKDKLYFEGYVGLGILQRQTSFKSVKISPTQQSDWGFWSFDYGKRSEGSVILPNFIVGFRLGYVLNSTAR